MNPQTNAKLLSTAETAAALGVSTETLARAVRLGHLPALRIGNQYAMTLDDAETWLQDFYHPTMIRPRKKRRIRHRE